MSTVPLLLRQATAVVLAATLLVRPVHGAQAPAGPTDDPPAAATHAPPATASAAAPATAAATGPGNIPAASPPAFDMEAARKQVRAMKFDEEVRAPVGGMLSAAPTREEQRFRTQFSEAKRPWCLTAFQGLGVLALVAMPLAMVLDKKDHGCKW